MEKSIYIKPMRTTLLVLLILCICSPVQCSAQAVEPNKPSVGLIRFSIDVFDKQKGLVEKERDRVETRFKKFLKENFKFRKEFYFKTDQDMITYSDIEDPEVTIDPQFESRADKKLKELSEKNKLNAIVFGHFQEEEDLIVVFRYYLAGDQIPKDQRIVSTKTIKVKIDKQIKNDLKNQVDSLAKELEDNLKAKFVKTQPEYLPVQPKEKHKENETGVQGSPQKTTVTEEEMLTAHEVYQMIIEKGFYCETVDNDYHKEALKGIHVPGNGIFEDKRFFMPYEESKEKIRTESEISSSRKEDEKIILRWPQEVELELCYYDEAKDRIDDLNKFEDDKDRKWRIPTIMELFSIIKGDTKNHFPEIFHFPKQDKDIIFWTSTVVKKEGTKLDYDKKNKAYMAVQSKYSSTHDIYSLTFTPLNIEGKEKKKAYLLPVYSDNEYRYKQTQDKIPGFDDVNNSKATSNSSKNNPGPSAGSNTSSTGSQIHASSKNSPNDSDDRIPGFDDVPDPSNASSKKKEDKTSDSRMNASNEVRIAIYPYTYPGIPGDIRKKSSLNQISDEIEKELNSLKLNMEKYKFELTIIKENSYSLNKNLITLHSILYKKILERSDVRNEVLNEAKSRIMNLENIDIIVTVKHFILGNSAELLNPIIISGIDNRVYFSNLGQNSGSYEDLIDFIREKILSILYKKI